ncbi:MAG: hypothetical protein ISR72_00975 [Methylobacter sp.]|nr:hypothetical protein [Methylobacter sp.]
MKILLIGLLFVITSSATFAADDTSVVDLRDTPSTPAPEENSNTSTVDLSDKQSDVVYSPSLENTTPAGQAPGGPVE